SAGCSDAERSILSDRPAVGAHSIACGPTPGAAASASRHAETPAQPVERVVRLLRCDELEPHRHRLRRKPPPFLRFLRGQDCVIAALDRVTTMAWTEWSTMAECAPCRPIRPAIGCGRGAQEAACIPRLLYGR